MASGWMDWALYLLVKHDLPGKPVSTFPDHALREKHDLLGKPVSTFPDHALREKHDLLGKPVSTFPDHALSCSAHAGKRVTDAATVVAIRSRSSLAALLRCC
jgi:hypothetical protein